MQGVPKSDARVPPIVMGTLLILEMHSYPLETPSYHLCNHTNFGRSKPNDTRIIIDPPEKIWPLTSRFSRSLKVTGTDRDQSATYDFLLVIHSNHEPILYRFQDKKQ